MRRSIATVSLSGMLRAKSEAIEGVPAAGAGRTDHPHLGRILDSFHTLVLRDGWRAIAALPGERIFSVQLADAPWVNTDPLTHIRHFRCCPGQGEMRSVLNLEDDSFARCNFKRHGTWVCAVAPGCMPVAGRVGVNAGCCSIARCWAWRRADLDAGHGIDPDTPARGCRSKLRMERDAEGSDFLHACTAPFGDQFVFGVMQRRGGCSGHRGYGATDAPMRLAALAQWRREHPPE